MIRHLVVDTPGQGLHEITGRIEAVVRAAGISEGLCTLFVQHTSASLLVQENADPSARHDLEQWLNQLVSESNAHYTHRNEGPDDMPAHIKSALTATQLSIPVSGGRLMLGTWQGIFLWEHRRRGGARRIVVHLGG